MIFDGSHKGYIIEDDCMEILYGRYGGYVLYFYALLVCLCVICINVCVYMNECTFACVCVTLHVEI